MKKFLFIPVILAVLLTIAPTQRSYAIWGIVTAAVKKVVKAMDIQVQRLQNRTIALQNAQKALENVMSKLRLEEISDWTERQKVLYQDYFAELWKVKSAIAYYRRISDIVQLQAAIVQEYRRAFSLLRQDRHFTPDEIDHIYTVYSNIIAESLKNVEDVLAVANSFTVQMNDAERLKIIDDAALRVEGHYSTLRRFTRRTVGISLERATTVRDAEKIKELYGIQ